MFEAGVGSRKKGKYKDANATKIGINYNGSLELSLGAERICRFRDARERSSQFSLPFPEGARGMCTCYSRELRGRAPVLNVAPRNERRIIITHFALELITKREIAKLIQEGIVCSLRTGEIFQRKEDHGVFRVSKRA